MGKFIDNTRRKIAESDFGDEFIDVDYDRLETTKEKKARIAREKKEAQEEERKRAQREAHRKKRQKQKREKERAEKSSEEAEENSSVEEIEDLGEEELDPENFFEEINEEADSPTEDVESEESAFDVDQEDLSEFDNVDAYADYDQLEDFAEQTDNGDQSLEDLLGEDELSGENHYSEEENENPEDEDDDSESAVDKWKGQAAGFWNKLKDDGKKAKNKKSKKKKDDSVPEESHAEAGDGAFDDSAFDVSEEENEGLLVKIAKKGKKTKEERVQAAKDILEVLEIPETYVIDKHYYMPDDLKDITFSYKTPMGFDEKEVEKFYNGVIRTVKNYVDILQERNRHIVTLAAEVDKKDEIIAKLRYDQEISQGINVMPTQGDHETENQLMHEKLENKKLKQQLQEAQAEAAVANERAEQLNKKKSSVSDSEKEELNAKLTETLRLSEEEREKYNELQDSYSLLKREFDQKDDEIKELKKKIAVLEDESGPDFSTFFDPPSKQTGQTDNENTQDAEKVEPKKKQGLPTSKKPEKITGNPFE